MLRYPEVITSRRLLLAAVFFAFGTGVFPAFSGAAVPPDFSVTDQYVEAIPGVTGGKNVKDTKGGKPQRSAKLASLKKHGDDGAELSELVALTAPDAALSDAGEGSSPGSAGKPKGPGASDSSGPESDPAIVAVASQALEPAQAGSIGIFFPIALVFLTAMAIGYLVLRTRGNGSQIS